jgi:hypothetical protein
MTMICPPGSEPYVTLNRLDGYIGQDIPQSVAEHVCAQWPELGRRRTEVDRIRARMMALQITYERRKKIVSVLRQRFGLLTR